MNTFAKTANRIKLESNTNNIEYLSSAVSHGALIVVEHLKGANGRQNNENGLTFHTAFEKDINLLAPCCP